MKKLLTLLFAAITIGTTAAQLAIPGEVFAENPARFNGRRVTIKNIDIIGELPNSNQPQINISPAAPFTVSPGAIGTPTAPKVAPCRPPRGFSEIIIFFKGNPGFNGCFFMQDAMKDQLYRELGGQNIEAQISFRGDHRTGYNVTFYRLGR